MVFPQQNVLLIWFERGDRSLSWRWPPLRLTAHSWRWRLDRVRVTSTFGERSGSFHEGIDLQAPVGTSVHAAEEGRVVFAGNRILARTQPEGTEGKLDRDQVVGFGSTSRSRGIAQAS